MKTLYTKGLKNHLEQEHKKSPITEYLKEIVYGGIDGIITTFAVVAGYAGASSGDPTQLSVFALLLFGFANLFADGISMGVGNFLSVRTEQDLYRSAKQKELEEIEKNPKAEEEETKFILMDKGFSKKDAETLTQIYKKNKDYWVEFMMKNELEMQNPEGENPFLTATATISSFLIFGLIPLIPYLMVQETDGILIYSVLFTALALVILGILKWVITRKSLAKSIFETLILGGIAASVAFLVGSLWKNKL